MKVRVAAAIDYEGTWSVYGAKGMSEQEMMDLVIDNVQEGERRFWVEIELTMPVPSDAQVIQAILVGEVPPGFTEALQPGD